MQGTRRRFLTGSTAVAGTLVAGCLGGGSEDGDGQNGGRTLDSHPAAQGLDSQPHLGPAPGEATGTIVAFEDPSCPRCKTFEEQTVPKIRSELVDPGDATFVFRGYPIVYEWGKPGTRALEATYARNEDAHWALVDHYFTEQDGFRSAGRDAVLDRTREFLAAETEVNADAVVTAVENGDAESAVQTDLDAGEAAGASATPAVYLFRDGQYRTSYSGSVGFDAVRSTLGL
ncbi:DsbA family protein [Halorientalis pallida]|uniref:Twin-arginine translocation signal domain-containing protein n=1 Tax=Halorientalis pallida TaxID=2479928 RepID=A0A498L185_9EURY|nr:thioredoxin domain-containing protein [Halorientalis pallida]RXK51736.1 twin-arginine translocation signal domain-containing protein [Halorientalis pallida]